METIIEILLVAAIIGFFWLVSHFSPTVALVIFILFVLWVLSGAEKFNELRRDISEDEINFDDIP